MQRGVTVAPRTDRCVQQPVDPAKTSVSFCLDRQFVSTSCTCVCSLFAVVGATVCDCKLKDIDRESVGAQNT